MFLLEDHLIPSLYGTALQQQAVNLEKKIIKLCALHVDLELIGTIKLKVKPNERIAYSLPLQTE